MTGHSYVFKPLVLTAHCSRQADVSVASTTEFPSTMVNNSSWGAESDTSEQVQKRDLSASGPSPFLVLGHSKSSAEAAMSRQREVMESTWPTIATVSQDAFQKDDSRLSTIYEEPFAIQHEAMQRNDNLESGNHQTKPVGPDSNTHGASDSRDEQARKANGSLQVPKHDDRNNSNYDGPVSFDRCKWNLLSKPQNRPNIPTISVTSPAGVVKYPQDHTFYLDQGDISDDDDSDIYD